MSIYRRDDDPRATTEEAHSPEVFKYDPSEKLILVKIDQGHHYQWEPFRYVEDRHDAVNFAKALNAVCRLMSGTAGGL